MKLSNLKLGHENNQIQLLVTDIDLKPYCALTGECAMVLDVKKFNLENLLTQLIEDYGEDDLIKRIKELK